MGRGIGHVQGDDARTQVPFSLSPAEPSIPLTLVCTTRILDAGGHLRPLRRHEQDVSSKKFYALYCNANLSGGEA
jgi:hypothetical protein